MVHISVQPRIAMSSGIVAPDKRVSEEDPAMPPRPKRAVATGIGNLEGMQYRVFVQWMDGKRVAKNLSATVP